MNNIQKKVCKTAILLKDLPQGKNRHFSFITKRNKIVSIGWNKSFKTHPLANKFGHRFNCIHSELDVINSFNYSIKELQNYSIYNVRVMKDGKIGYSKPCDICQDLLVFFGLKKIYYSNWSKFNVFSC